MENDSDSKKIIVAPIDQETYTKTFAMFMQSSTEYEEMPKMILPIVEGFKTQRPIDMMSIGAGNGCFEGDLVMKLGLNLNYFFAVEPNKKHSKQLIEEISRWNINDNYEVCTDYFTPSFTTSRRFDLIMMSHCLYCMENPVDLVMTAKSFLKPNGKLVIFIRAETHTYKKLHKRLLEKVQFSSATISDITLTSAEICKALADNKAKFGVQHGPSLLNVDDFLRERDTPNANNVFTFILQTEFGDLSEQLKRDIYQMVKGNSFINADGKYMFKHPTAMIVVEQ
eukprot:gene17281-19008_t